MIKIRRNCKEIEGKSFGARKIVKTGEKQGSARFRSLKEASAKSALCWETISQLQQVRCEIATSLQNRHFAGKPFRSPNVPLCENFRSCETTSWHTSAISQHSTPISQLRNGCEIPKVWNLQFSQPKPYFAGCFATTKPPFGTRVPFRSPVHSFRSCEMVVKSSMP